VNRQERMLVLIRHGNSEWNISERFTGWADIPMCEQGGKQSEAAGRHLAGKGIVFDEVHTSMLHRTHQTADRLLAASDNPPVTRHETWRLNERHYGQLQGMSKGEIFAMWGEQKSRRWWRGYFDPPPPLEMDDPRHPRFDPLYAELDAAQLPCGESLSDCQRRLLPYWHEVLAPRLLEGRRMLVVSHGNTLRSLAMHLENIAPDDIEKFEIHSGVPLIYRFDDALGVIGREWLE